MPKYDVGLKTLLQEGLSEPKLNSNLFYKFRKIVGQTDFRNNLKRLSFTITREVTAWIF